jgi:hypothetical protein
MLSIAHTYIHTHVHMQGNITGKQYLYDENKNELACIDVKLKL